MPPMPAVKSTLLHHMKSWKCPTDVTFAQFRTMLSMADYPVTDNGVLSANGGVFREFGALLIPSIDMRQSKTADFVGNQPFLVGASGGT